MNKRTKRAFERFMYDAGGANKEGIEDEMKRQKAAQNSRVLQPERFYE